jgi:outer membrane beta-barrel protein
MNDTGRKSRSIWFRLALVSAAAFWLALVAVSWADAAEGDGTDEYSFNWLDPEKKIYVLQNRRYLKGGRLFLSATVGPGLSNPYRTTLQIDPRAAFYFNETFGLEVFYTLFSNKENSTFEALKKAATNTLPVVREIKAQYGALLHYVPWYAKINVFNNILYFDWYFSGGIGQVSSDLDTRSNASAEPVYVKQDFMGLFLGTGHQYHLSNNFSVRLDFTGAFYQAPIFGDEGDKSVYSNYTFGIGLGIRL